MKKILCLLMVNLLIICNPTVAQESANPCQDVQLPFVDNSWLISIGVEDFASEDIPSAEDIIKVLGTLRTKGFTEEVLLTFYNAVAFSVQFDPSVYDNSNEANRAKEEVFRVLTSIDSVTIACDGILSIP